MNYKKNVYKCDQRVSIKWFKKTVRCPLYILCKMIEILLLIYKMTIVRSWNNYNNFQKHNQNNDLDKKISSVITKIKTNWICGYWLDSNIIFS